MLWEAFTARRPHEGYTAAQLVVAAASDLLHLTWPPDAPPALVSLIEACTSRQPDERPTFEYLMNAFVQMETKVRLEGGPSYPGSPRSAHSHAHGAASVARGSTGSLLGSPTPGTASPSAAATAAAMAGRERERERSRRLSSATTSGATNHSALGGMSTASGSMLGQAAQLDGSSGNGGGCRRPLQVQVQGGNGAAPHHVHHHHHHSGHHAQLQQQQNNGGVSSSYGSANGSGSNSGGGPTNSSHAGASAPHSTAQAVQVLSPRGSVGLGTRSNGSSTGGGTAEAPPHSGGGGTHGPNSCSTSATATGSNSSIGSSTGGSGHGRHCGNPTAAAAAMGPHLMPPPQPPQPLQLGAYLSSYGNDASGPTSTSTNSGNASGPVSAGSLLPSPLSPSPLTVLPVASPVGGIGGPASGQVSPNGGLPDVTPLLCSRISEGSSDEREISGSASGGVDRGAGSQASRDHGVGHGRDCSTSPRAHDGPAAAWPAGQRSRCTPVQEQVLPPSQQKQLQQQQGGGFEHPYSVAVLQRRSRLA